MSAPVEKVEQARQRIKGWDDYDSLDSWLVTLWLADQPYSVVAIAAGLEGFDLEILNDRFDELRAFTLLECPGELPIDRIAYCTHCHEAIVECRCRGHQLG